MRKISPPDAWHTFITVDLARVRRAARQTLGLVVYTYVLCRVAATHGGFARARRVVADEIENIRQEDAGR